ncbi:TIGR03862 family flavoprotein [Rhodobacteraceae bacterium KN286]|uniref:TIGR03862 family flavoprotein n=2 Tax=Oceanomicrobium pacificus TaxID=2692916 RepID=A0A6B0TSP9_9RHOB|nr:TIGR03862 family flavoprotein [Oceanomicrobium pacificus]
MAAETLAAAGRSVLVAEAKPTLARKFLMAGKSGLNLTMDEPAAQFRAAFRPCPPALHDALTAFGPEEVQTWARGLGSTVFTGTSGRVFPTEMKASPLLRAWIARLRNAGVELRTGWRWTGQLGACPVPFDTPEGAQHVHPRVTLLALGGASWPRLGSDGVWVGQMPGPSDCAPFRPANMGFRRTWSRHMEPHFGAALKQVRLSCGPDSVLGECVISKAGFEGSAIYALSRALRKGGAGDESGCEGGPVTLHIDLMPDRTADQLAQRLHQMPSKTSLSNKLRKLGLPPAKLALLQECARPLPGDPAALAGLLKALSVALDGPMSLDRAISTAGGLRFERLTGDLELAAHPGWFSAGEMLDWEAPTGGYLLTGCFATGRHAARGALKRLDAAKRGPDAGPN